MRRSAPGAFKWVERVAGDHIELVANPDYFGDGPYLERLIFKYIPDLTVLYTQFKTGDIDIVGLQWITADHYEEASKLAGPGRDAGAEPFVENIYLQHRRPQFKDQAVREALYYGMDKQAIIDALYYGLPTPTETFLPQQSCDYNPDLPKHELQPREGEADPGRGRLGAGRGRHPREGRRAARRSPTRPPPATTSASRRSSSSSRPWPRSASR